MNTDQFLHQPHPFLAGLTVPQLRTLLDLAREMQFAALERIFREGEHAGHLYLIEEGAVILRTYSAGHPVLVGTVEAGEALGRSWLFPPYCWHFDAWAGKDVRCLAFDAMRLRDLCAADKALGYELMQRMLKVLAQRLQATRLQLARNCKADLHASLPVG